MAVHVSPGVYFETLDFSLYAPRLSKTNLALVGKFKKGPTDITFVSSARQFVDLFGTPEKGMYASYAALSYLEFGTSLWVKRLVGPKATKASVEIPMGNVVSNELLGVGNGYDYILKGTFNKLPIAGTVKILIGKWTEITDSNPYKTGDITKLDNGKNMKFTIYHTIIDDGQNDLENKGNLLSSGISTYPNFMDYDTGSFYFTLSSAPTAGQKVSIRYNYKYIHVTSEELGVGNGTGKIFSGMLSHGKIRKTNFSITDGLEKFTIGTITGNNAVLNGDAATPGTGTLNTKTGEYSITFNTAPLTNSNIIASYDYETYKDKELFTGDGERKAFIGSVNNIVSPESVFILVDDVKVAEDNGYGVITGGVIESNNKIDYDDGKFEFTLMTSIESDSEILTTYSGKNAYLIKTVDNTDGKNYSAVITNKDIIKGSVSVSVGALLFNDDKNGSLIGTGGNGTIDYQTGAIELNLSTKPSNGTSIIANFLTKFGTLLAISEGEWGNNIKVQFLQDAALGYCIKVWDSDQNISLTPKESFVDVVFDDINSVDYFETKLSSRLIEFETNTNLSTDMPLLGYINILDGGFSDFDNIKRDKAVAAIEDFSNPESFDINLIMASDFPGDKVVANKLIQMCETRGDCMAIIDPPRDLTPQQVADWHNGDGQWAIENSLNSCYGALYFPWIKIFDQFTNSYQWVPPSVKIAAVYAYSDNVSEPWFAPAGLNRGRLFNVLSTERYITVGERDLLYGTPNSVNPIVDFPKDGIVVWGQKTLQRKPSALDRVNVMRLLIYVTKVLATAVKYLVFEPNDPITWILYRQLVNPFIADIQSRRGLYEYSIVCDESTNTSYNIDNNEMVGELYLKPTKAAEKIINRFIITSTGASFSEIKKARSNS